MDESPKPPANLLDRASQDPLFSILAGWLVPGAGHIVAGKTKKGVFFFVILVATFFTGLYLADFRTVRYSDNPFYFVGQVGSGLNLLLTAVLTELKPAGKMPQIYFEPGLLYMSVSGLLNILIVMSIHPLPERSKEPEPGKSEGTAEKAG